MRTRLIGIIWARRRLIFDHVPGDVPWRSRQRNAAAGPRTFAERICADGSRADRRDDTIITSFTLVLGMARWGQQVVFIKGYALFLRCRYMYQDD